MALGLQAEILAVAVTDGALNVSARIKDGTGASLGVVDVAASDRATALDALRVAARKLASIQTGQVVDL